VAVAVVTTILLVFVRPHQLPLGGAVVGGVLLLAIIALTVRFQAPAHAKLARGLDADIHAMLVRTNWARAAAWTLLGVLDLWMLYQVAH
jgi:hypothetical protein